MDGYIHIYKLSVVIQFSILPVLLAVHCPLFEMMK